VLVDGATQRLAGGGVGFADAGEHARRRGAAARLRSMSLAELSGRLDQRFRLLTGGSRTALERQQTLRATVGWS
jgi:predicted ATPase